MWIIIYLVVLVIGIISSGIYYGIVNDFEIALYLIMMAVSWPLSVPLMLLALIGYYLFKLGEKIANYYNNKKDKS